MSDVIKLRKLSRKSVIDFGMNEGLRIQDLLNLRKYRQLRYIYYAYSKLSFLDDILEEIGITEDFKINKPGKDLEMNKKINKCKDEISFGLTKHIRKLQVKKQNRRDRVLKRVASNIKFSKANLTRKNQGH